MKKELSAKYKSILGVFDVCFGSYTMLMAVVAGFFYFQGMISLLTLALFMTFPLLNLITSRFTYRAEIIFNIEIFRIFICNGFIAGSIFAFSDGPLANSSTSLLISCVAGGIFCLTWTGQRLVPYLQMVYWVGVLFIANLLAPSPLPWVTWMMDTMSLIMLSALLVEVVRLLNLTLQRESEAKIQLFHTSKLSALGEMAGGIAHEINNPLAIISMTIKSVRKMLKKGVADPEEYESLFNDVDATVHRITKIIHGLRNLSRDTSREEFVPSKIQDCLNDVLSTCSERFRSHQVSFNLVGDEAALELEIDMMRVQISQVFLNLLSNAFDAIESLPEKWIKIHVRDEGDVILFQVEDSGSGLSVQAEEKIFEPYYTTKEIGKGTGLGLSLSNTIIRKHGGKLYVDRNFKHTCFAFDLPKVQMNRKA